jgi:hypothetical protein
MRKIRIIEHISLDGVIQAPGGRDEGGEDYAKAMSSGVLMNTYRHVGSLRTESSAAASG